MSTYKKSFTFNVKEIDLIEQALRDQMRVLAHVNLNSSDSQAAEVKANEAMIRELNELMGKIHNQKVFYGQVHHTGAPISG